MELSLRLDTLGMVEMRYLRNRERYRDWPSFQLLRLHDRHVLQHI